MPASEAKSVPRFHREAWLRAALEVLAREGQARLRVETLAAELGVTKGSFYHHFENRQDFVRRLTAYWSSAFTDWVVDEVESAGGTAEERLLTLMRLIERERLDRYDIAFRSWAAQDPAVAEDVKAVDGIRYRYLRSLFAEMGFEGADLEDRVRLWLVFESAQRTVFVPESGARDEDAVARRHAFFVRR